MAQAHDLAKKALTYSQKGSTTHGSREPENMVLISQLFVRFGSIYGHLWISRFNTEKFLKATKREWAVELGKYNPQQIESGIQRAKKKHTTHPPTLPEFMMLCENDDAPCHKPYKALPKPEPDEEVAKKHIATMRNILKPKSPDFVDGSIMLKMISMTNSTPAKKLELLKIAKRGSYF